MLVEGLEERGLRVSPQTTGFTPPERRLYAEANGIGDLERQSEDGLHKRAANDWSRDLWSRASTHHSTKVAPESSGCLELLC